MEQALDQLCQLPALPSASVVPSPEIPKRGSRDIPRCFLSRGGRELFGCGVKKAVCGEFPEGIKVGRCFQHSRKSYLLDEILASLIFIVVSFSCPFPPYQGAVIKNHFLPDCFLILHL